MSESVEKVNNLLHAALLMRVEPGDRPPGAGYPLRLHRMDGEDWVDARDRIEAAKAHVVRVAEDILPADLMMTDRAFRVLFLAEEWAGVVVDERRFMRCRRRRWALLRLSGRRRRCAGVTPRRPCWRRFWARRRGRRCGFTFARVMPAVMSFLAIGMT